MGGEIMLSKKALINELLVDIFNHILTIEEDELKTRGVTLSIKEVHVLEAISLVEDKTMGNVAKKLTITVGTLTSSIDRLVKKGYVLRANDEFDRRKVLLDLSSRGKKVLEIHDDFHNKMLDSLFEEYNLEDEVVLLKSLENIKNYFKLKY